MQLYSLATPNGQKVSVALEEMQLPYEAHTIDIRTGAQHEPDYVALNPNGKIPTLVDPDGPDGESITLMETGAILLYLAEKSGQFWFSTERERYEALPWLFFQTAHIGPMFGQFGHFYALGGATSCDHPYPLERYSSESKRLLGVLESRLTAQPYVGGQEYSIVDMAIFPWVHALDWAYDAREQLDLASYSRVNEWLTTCLDRPAATRGLDVCPFPKEEPSA